MNPTFQHIALIGKHHTIGHSPSSTPHTAAILKSLADFLRQQGCQVTIEQETAKHAGFQDLATLDVAGIAQHCNLALVLGGDGTMLGFGRQLAPHGVRVVSLAPTFIETPMTAPMLADETFSRFVLDRIPLGRVGTAAEVAAACVFLLSPAASMVTGSSLLADGGWTAQ
jgi:hypothetical protein